MIKFRAFTYTTFCLLVAFTFAPNASHAESSYLGKKRPDFSFPDTQNRTRYIKEWDGKILVLNFWATWCTPCLKEIPMFNRVQDEYAEDVQFVGIAVDNANSVNQFMKKVSITYPVLIGKITASTLARQYGNVRGVLPYTVFIDRNGKIASIAAGKLTQKDTTRIISKLL